MKIFESKADNWVVFLIFSGAMVCFYFAISMVLSFHFGQFLLAVCIFLVCVVLPLWIVVFTHYSLSSQELKVWCGPFKWTIPREEITSVTEIRSYMSAPALSFDRLKIIYSDGKSVTISPSEKNAFLLAMSK